MLTKEDICLAGIKSYYVEELQHIKNNPVNNDQVLACKKWITENFVQAKTFSSDSSYGFKHMAERDLGMYVANGSFIYAAIELGIEAAPDESERLTPNAKFKMETKKDRVITFK